MKGQNTKCYFQVFKMVMETREQAKSKEAEAQAEAQAHCKKYFRINPSNNRGAKHFLCHWRFNPLRIFHLPNRDISLNVSIDPKICMMCSMQIPVWNWINPNLPVDVRVAFGFDSQYLSIHPIWYTDVWSQDLGNFWSQDLELVELIWMVCPLLKIWRKNLDCH